MILASQVTDGSLVIAATVAAAAGALSFLSPCVLPLVPGYLSSITGLSASELATQPPTAGGRRAHHVALASLLFILGFSVVFVSFGALAGGLGGLLRDHQETLTRVLGVFTIGLGLMFAGALNRVPVLSREFRLHRIPAAGTAGAPLLGALFGLGWTPCIGPTLAAVLGLAASENGASAARGTVLAFVYCLGLGIPFLVTGLAFERAISAFGIVKRNYRLVMTAGGAMLVVIGVLEVTGLWSEALARLQSYLGTPSLPL
jgi:cytochrome c-type biogenesis protein